MKAIILAAGLGSRFGRLTKNNHKSLIKVGNLSILERLISQLEKYGVKDINIICGHQKEKIDKKLLNHTTFFYPNYKTTNNLHTLYHFKKLLDQDCIISFADVILDKNILRDLIRSKKNITLSVDRRKSKKGTMKIEIVKNKLIYLGNNPKIDSGNYIGIMKLKKKMIKKFILAMKKIKDKSKNQYFTEAFNYLINKKFIEVNYQDVNKKFWIEIDNLKDLKIAKKIIK